MSAHQRGRLPALFAACLLLAAGQALAQGDPAHAQSELGDVLFTLVNLARWSNLDPEAGLAGTNRRFIDRFSRVEAALGGDLGDLLGGLFTRGRPGPGGPGGPGGRPGGGTGPRRGPDVTADLHIEFMEALRGATVSVNVDTTARCGDCHGSGAAAGTSPVTCSMCGGMGSVQENQGPFSFSRPCDRCGGAGQVIEQPCRTCGGTGAVRRPQQAKVRIPRGIRNEGRVRVKGRGGAGTNGGSDGDLFVTVHVRPHPTFRRDGDNLLLTVPVTFDELVLGADVELPTVEGESVTIRVPAGTKSGKKFRVRGKGVTTGKGTGDLVATVEVVVPAQVDDATRAAVEAFAAAAVGSPRDALRETVQRVAGTAPTEESGAGDA